jgi:hypothetical protein
MQHHPSSSASPADHPKSTEIQDFDARLNAILAGPSALDGILVGPRFLTQHPLDEIENTVCELQGSDGLWGVDEVTHTKTGDNYRFREDMVMNMDATVLRDLPHTEPGNQQPEMAMQQVVVGEQVEDVAKQPEEHYQDGFDAQLEVMLTEFLEKQTTQTTKLPTWNPYAYSDVKDVVPLFKPTTSDNKRKIDEYQSEASCAFLLNALSTPEPSSVHARAEVHPQAYGLLPSPALHQAVPQYASELQYTSGVVYQNAGLTGAQSGPLPSVQYNAPVASTYDSSNLSQDNHQSASPYTDRLASSYTTPPASPYPGYAPASPSDYAPTSPHCGYAPAQPIDPTASQYKPTTSLKAPPEAIKCNLSVQSKESSARVLSGIPLAFRNIIRSMGKRPTAELYRAALDMNQQIYDWRNERDRLEDVVEKNKKQNAEKNSSTKIADERHVRKKLSSSIRSVQKKFQIVNAELEKRGVIVPV